MSMLLLAKLLTSPLLIGAASLAGKRWGPNVAGVLGGLPLVAGPIVLVLWLSHGPVYVTQLALAAPVGVWANVAYMLIMAWASQRLAWWGALLLAWISYVMVALLLHAVGIADNIWLGLAVLPGLWLAATRWLPRPEAPPQVVALPRSELLTRMLAAAGLVTMLTTVSPLLGPTLTGIFTGAPVAGTVIPAFTFARSGRNALLLVLRGFLTGLMGLTVFFLVLGWGVPLLGIWGTLLAALAGVLVGLAASEIVRRTL